MRRRQQLTPSFFPASDSDKSNIESCFDTRDKQEEIDVEAEPTNVDTDVDGDDEADLPDLERLARENNAHTVPIDIDADVNEDNEADLAWIAREENAYPPEYYLDQENNFNKFEDKNKDYSDVLILKRPKGASRQDLFERSWWSRTWILQEVIHDGEVLVHIGALDPINIDTLCEMTASYQQKLVARAQFPNWEAGIQLNGELNPGTDFYGWVKAGESIHGTIKDMRDMYRGTGEAGAAHPPKLSALLMKTRIQGATDPLDKIYGLVGMTDNKNTYDIDTDYNITKEALYTKVTRHLLSRVLYVLSWVESPDRDVSDQNLPSWAIDFTVRQEPLSMSMAAVWPYFSANENFPPTTGKEPHLDQTLIVRGIQVGSIVEVRDATFPSSSQLEGDHIVRIFGYKSSGGTHAIDRPDRQGTFRNTSWGPKNSAAGDIIVVAPGSTVPLVLRTVSSGECLFAGVCWLIESEIQNLIELGSDPGLSKVMTGSACAGAKQSDVKLFHIR
ncbi:hypothetical protein DL98DRAFT_576982 [Cadophora sp. DSE1049]|nr:hypothetical protein DL98DRAFT_576982 [Cadophora sp. DSE1049]